MRRTNVIRNYTQYVSNETDARTILTDAHCFALDRNMSELRAYGVTKFYDRDYNQRTIRMR